MRRRAIITLTVSTLMAACAHQGPQTAAMPGMAWSLSQSEGEGAKLAYGQPSSDNVLLMMTCRPKSGTVGLSLASPAGAPAIELSSRGKSSRLRATSTTSGLSDGALLEANASAADPVLKAFARSGDLALVENGKRTALPVRAGERGHVSDFLATCRA